MPTYPAFALLLGCVMASGSGLLKHAAKVVAAVATLACAAIVFILANVWSLPAPGDISQALTQNPELIHFVAGAHGRPDDEFVRVSETAAGAGRPRVCGGRILRLAVSRAHDADRRFGADDAAVAERGADRDDRL